MDGESGGRGGRELALTTYPTPSLFFLFTSLSPSPQTERPEQANGVLAKHQILNFSSNKIIGLNFANVS